MSYAAAKLQLRGTTVAFNSPTDSLLEPYVLFGVSAGAQGSGCLVVC